jgi:hypothetical protein
VSFAVVWFKDGEFLDGRTVEKPGECRIEMPADVRMYILPGEAAKMREEQPLSATKEALALLREARRNRW